MKAIGIIRKLDSLGRVTLPKEICRLLRITGGDPMEMFLDGDKIILQKFDVLGDTARFLDSAAGYIREDINLPDATVGKLLAKIDEMKEILAGEQEGSNDQR